MSEPEKYPVTNRDRDINGIRAAIKLIPAVGGALDQLLFEAKKASNTRRFEATMDEIHAYVTKSGRENTPLVEEFVNLLQDSCEPIANATQEDKRQRFRDLLINSVDLPPGDPAWAESMHCLDVLKETDGVGLYVLAVMAEANKSKKSVAYWRGNESEWAFVDLGRYQAGDIPLDRDAEIRKAQYHSVLIYDQLELLTSRGLIQKRNLLTTRGPAATGLDYYSLTERGQLLVRWAIAEF